MTGATEGVEAEEGGGQVVADGWGVEPQPPPAPSNGLPVRQRQGFDADPITPILTELLHGWGEFSSTEMKRLSLFRPEKVQAAVGALDIPKDLKNDQDAHGRLEQLALYASQLQAGTQGIESENGDVTAESGSEARPDAEVDAAEAGTTVERHPRRRARRR